MKEKQKMIRLTERDLKILQFIARNRIAWFQVLHRKFFHEQEPDAVRSTLRRLAGPAQRSRFLKPTRLPHGRVYYQLTYAGTKQVGCSPALTRPLSPQGRASRYALQWFIFVDGHGHRMLVPRKKLPADFSR